MTITAGQRHALGLIGAYTGGTFDIYRMAGPSNADRRQEVMTALTGTKTPKAKAGVNAIIAAVYDLSGVALLNETMRGKEIAFEAWAKNELGDA